MGLLAWSERACRSNASKPPNRLVQSRHWHLKLWDPSRSLMWTVRCLHNVSAQLRTILQSRQRQGQGLSRKKAWSRAASCSASKHVASKLALKASINRTHLLGHLPLVTQGFSSEQLQIQDRRELPSSTSSSSQSPSFALIRLFLAHSGKGGTSM